MRDVRAGPASCVDLVRHHDWSQTALGDRAYWPARLRAVVEFLLEAPLPMCYCHGPDFVLVYNDSMARMLGDRHTRSWARPAREIDPRTWADPRIGAALEGVLQTGDAFFEDGTVPSLSDQPFSGTGPDAYMVRGISPVRDDDGAVMGVLVVAIANSLGVERLRTVADLASSLASAVSVDDVVKAALRHAVHALHVDEVAVCLPERRTGGWRTTRRRQSDVVSRDEERLPLIWSPPDPDADRSLVEAAESGEPAATAQPPEAVLPFVADGASGGVRFRGVENSGGGASSPSEVGVGSAGLEVPLLATCTDLVAEALARAWLYDAERDTADLLQRTMLPQMLPHRPGVSVAVRYQPVTTGTAAGGDFYDVFAVSDGRLAVVIGDVAGRGVAAATVMGQVRAAVRGAALAAPEPERVFYSLDQLVLSLDEAASMRPAVHAQRSEDPLALGVSGELFVTMLFCLLDPATGRYEMASAGHFPPVLLRGGHTSFAHLEVGTPLGLPGPRPVSTGALGEGDAMVAFTDGLLERRDRPLGQGESALLAALEGEGRREPRSLCQLTLERMMHHGGLEDDCAVLAVVRTHAQHRTATAVVPPLASAVRRARAWVSGQLAAWEVDEDVVWVAVMGASELVTNALLHAGTDARISLDLSPDRLLVLVADAGTRDSPTRMPGDPSAIRGRGLGLVEHIADASGFERNVAGSTVWFEIRIA